MRLKQLSVFVENKPGGLVEMLRVLRQNGIDIKGLSVADHADFGIVRLILSDVDRGSDLLREAGFTVRTSYVLRVEVPDEPGGLLSSVAEPLAQVGINIEYMYASVEPAPGSKAVVIVKVSDLERAEQVLKS